MISVPMRPSTGATAAGGSQAVISADGGWIAFLSAATNLVAGQTGPAGVSPHVFLHQRATGTATLVSHAAGAPLTVANRFSLSAVISPDGRWVAYLSEATDLVAGQLDTNSLEDAFLYDRTTGASTLISHTPGAPTVAGNFAARDLGVSADGQLVVFASRASDLVAGDTNQASDVFLHTTATGTNTLISHAVSTSAPAAGDSEVPVFAADASGVVFRSSAYNLVSGQDDVVSVLGYDLFQWTRASDTVTLLTQEDGVPLRATNAPVSDAWVSGDGAWVAFSGTSERLDATVDDAKKLYSGFDLCDPKTSVSMTINGPAPMLLAFFMNAAIDQETSPAHATCSTPSM